MALHCTAVVHSAPSSVTREVVLISPVKLCAPVSLTLAKVGKTVIYQGKYNVLGSYNSLGPAGPDSFSDRLKNDYQ